MAEPAQFNSTISLTSIGGSFQATDSATTTIAVINTPVIAANTFAATGTALQVIVNASDLEADHAGGGARIYNVDFHGRVSKVAGTVGDGSVHIFKNGAALASPLTRCVSLEPTDPASEFDMHATISLVDGDTVEIFLENNADTDDLSLIEGATLSINA